MYSEINLSISDEIYNTLALMYFDPISEGLRELDDTALYFEIAPYESSIRRFYLTGNLITHTDTLLSVSVNLDTPQKNNYQAKVLIGADNPRLYNFENAIHVATTKYGLSPSYFANAIPVDILISSKSETESIVILDIKIEAVKAKNSLDCIPNGFSINNAYLPIADYQIDYSVNSGPKQRWTFDSIDWQNESISSSDLLAAFFFNDSQNSIGEVASIVGGGGGVAAFQYYNGELNASSGGYSNSSPTTVTLYAIEGQDNDPIQTLFDSNSITVHACGLDEWPGF